MAEKHFDDVLALLGMGKWNIFLYVGFSLCKITIVGFSLSGPFMTPPLDFECFTPENANITEIKMCSYVQSTIDIENGTFIAVEHKCSKWNFSTSVFQTSLTSEFELVCEKAYLRPTYQSIYTMGSLLFAPVTGMLSDKYGRKTLFGIGSVFLISIPLLTTILSSYYSILACHFFTGAINPLILQTGYILCMETCAPKMRSALGLILSVPWALGLIWWGGLGILISDWRWRIRALVMPGILFVIFFLRSIDESPRWEIVAGDQKKAINILRKAARWNCATLPSEESLLITMKEIKKTSSSNTTAQSRRPTGLKTKFCDLINYILILYKTPELRRRVLLICVMFIVSAATYYGVSLNSVNFNVDPFLYMIVGGLIEIPSYVVPIPIIAKLGRIPPTIALYITCGISLIALALVSPDLKWLVYVLALTAKFCISSAYQIIILLSSEITPTEVRMQTTGMARSVGRIGPILAPYLIDSVGLLYSWMSTFLFGIISLTAGIATYFLPESNNKELPETIEQIEAEAKLLKLEDKKDRN